MIWGCKAYTALPFSLTQTKQAFTAYNLQLANTKSALHSVQNLRRRLQTVDGPRMDLKSDYTKKTIVGMLHVRVFCVCRVVEVNCPT